MEAKTTNFNVNDLAPEDIASHPHVKEKFVQILISLHKMQQPDAESIYEKELIYFKKFLADPARKLKDCTKISLFSSFIEIAIQNLSIQDGSKSEAYLESRAMNIGTAENKKWVSTARFVITTYGELNLRIRSGQIVRMSNPIVIYEGDIFQPRTNDRGILFIDYAPKIPRQSSKIIGAWVAIHLPGGMVDFKWLLEDDIERLMKYSIPKGSNSDKGPNALYKSASGGIDPGFLETKTIKHAMRAYTKLRLAGTAVIENEEIEEEENFAQPANTKTEEQISQSVVINQKEEIF